MYNKLFTSILDSSIWLEPTHVRIVWITLLAAMDRDGFAHFSAIGNLSSRARVSDAEAEEAVKVLMAPDEHQPDQPSGGRRIERVPGGFLILNAPKYRAIKDSEDRLEANRKRVAEHRARIAALKEAEKNKTLTKAQRRSLNEASERAYDKAKNNGASEVEAMRVASEINGDAGRLALAAARDDGELQ